MYRFGKRQGLLKDIAQMNTLKKYSSWKFAVLLELAFNLRISKFTLL